MTYEAPGLWAADGVCRQVDPEIFFTKPSADAVSLCQECPVLDVCAPWTLENFADNIGVSGGMTPHKREKLRRWGDLAV